MKLSHKIFLGAGIALFFAVLLVAVENSTVVQLHLLGWTFPTTVLRLVLACLGIGLLIGAAFGAALTLRFYPKN